MAVPYNRSIYAAIYNPYNILPYIHNNNGIVECIFLCGESIITSRSIRSKTVDTLFTALPIYTYLHIDLK